MNAREAMQALLDGKIIETEFGDLLLCNEHGDLATYHGNHCVVDAETMKIFNMWKVVE